MIPSIMLMSALAATALGASNSTYTYTFPAGFNIGLVQPSDLSDWCLGQTNACPEICSGSTKQNTCDPKTLSFSCVCADGTTPDVSQYMSTVPFYVCQANFGQCINAHPNDSEGQRACKEAASNCGSKNASAASTTMSSTTTVASTTMSMATSTGSSQTSSSVAAASTTANAAANLAGLEGYSTGFVAGALFLAARLIL